jgi:hypothetical protein
VQVFRLDIYAFYFLSINNKLAEWLERLALNAKVLGSILECYDTVESECGR